MSVAPADALKVFLMALYAVIIVYSMYFLFLFVMSPENQPTDILTPQHGENKTIEFIGAVWNKTPLTVSVSSIPPLSEFIVHAKTAVRDWENMLNGAAGSDAFKFEIVPLDGADISINIKQATAGGPTILGVAKYSYSEGNLYSVVIEISVRGVEGDYADFRNVVRHEIGHALGLGHSNAPDDLMYPYYDTSEVNFDVYPSDLNVSAILYLYGSDGFGPENNKKFYTLDNMLYNVNYI